MNATVNAYELQKAVALISLLVLVSPPKDDNGEEVELRQAKRIVGGFSSWLESEMNVETFLFAEGWDPHRMAELLGVGSLMELFHPEEAE